MIWTIYNSKRYEIKFHKLRNVDNFYYLIFGYNKPYGWQNHWVQLRRSEDENIYKALFSMKSYELNKFLEEKFNGKYILDKLCFHKNDLKSVEELIESLIVMSKLIK